MFPSLVLLASVFRIVELWIPFDRWEPATPWTWSMQPSARKPVFHGAKVLWPGNPGCRDARSRRSGTASAVGPLSCHGRMGTEPRLARDSTQQLWSTQPALRPCSEICSFWRLFSISCTQWGQEFACWSALWKSSWQVLYQLQHRACTTFLAPLGSAGLKRFVCFRKGISQGRYLPDDWKPPETRQGLGEKVPECSRFAKWQMVWKNVKDSWTSQESRGWRSRVCASDYEDRLRRWKFGLKALWHGGLRPCSTSRKTTLRGLETQIVGLSVHFNHFQHTVSFLNQKQSKYDMALNSWPPKAGDAVVSANVGLANAVGPWVLAVLTNLLVFWNAYQWRSRNLICFRPNRLVSEKAIEKCLLGSSRFPWTAFFHCGSRSLRGGISVAAQRDMGGCQGHQLSHRSRVWSSFGKGLTLLAPCVCVWCPQVSLPWQRPKLHPISEIRVPSRKTSRLGGSGCHFWRWNRSFKHFQCSGRWHWVCTVYHWKYREDSRSLSIGPRPRELEWN